MNNLYDAPEGIIGKVVRTLLEQDARKVTGFLSPKLTVKASRVLFENKIHKRDKRADIRVTIGVPNYAERRFIKQCLKAGEPFPVKKLQIKALPHA